MVTELLFINEIYIKERNFKAEENSKITKSKFNSALCSPLSHVTKTCLLTTLRDDDSTIALGSLLQCLTTFSV